MLKSAVYNISINKLDQSIPKAHAQWVVVETRPLKGNGQPVVKRCRSQAAGCVASPEDDGEGFQGLGMQAGSDVSLIRVGLTKDSPSP